MPKPYVSKLVPVDVKVVWPMEASSFTPWLLANPNFLGSTRLGGDSGFGCAAGEAGSAT